MTDDLNYAQILRKIASDGAGYFSQTDIERLSQAADAFEKLQADLKETSVELKFAEADRKLFWEFRRAFKKFPKLPPPHVLKWLSGTYPEDWERGKQLQREIGLDAIPPKSECETGAGFWDRISKGEWRAYFSPGDAPKT